MSKNKAPLFTISHEKLTIFLTESTVVQKTLLRKRLHGEGSVHTSNL